MIKKYYSLTKPGLIYGNILTVIGGFLLAARGNINIALLFETIIGIALVVASGCVFNNFIDRDIDARMARTKDRALVRGTISKRATITYGTILGILGFGMLYYFTNVLTLFLAGLGFFVYVIVYSLWAKRNSVYGPIIGSISGSTPVVVGYSAAAGRFDIGAALLFIILCLWQIPHFYAIAIYRADDYAAADIPVYPLKRGMYRTKWHMLLYIAAFVFATFMLAVLGYLGSFYFGAAILLGGTWLFFSLEGFWTKNDKRWARKMFFVSLVVITLLFVTISVASAHIYQTDGSMTVLLHIDPDDDNVIATHPEMLSFEMSDASKKFTTAACNCNVAVLENGKELLNESLPFGSGEGIFDYRAPFTFPDAGNYEVQVSGTPKTQGAFAAFHMNYDVAVAAPPAQISLSDFGWIKSALYWLVGSLLIFFGILFSIKRFKK